MEYIEYSYRRYVTYSLGNVIKRVPGLTTSAGKLANGLTRPLQRQILLSENANLSTLLHELLHFEELIRRGLLG